MITDCDGCGEMALVNDDKFCLKCEKTTQLTATTVQGFIRLDRVELCDKAKCAIARIDINDSDAYLAMPTAIEFDGQIFGKTGWNSDRGEVYYRTDAPLAKIVR